MSNLKKQILEHPRNKFIHFDEDAHEYWYYPSGDKRKKKERVQFSGITGWIGSFSKKPFDAQEVAEGCNSNPNSKYYQMGVDNILQQWTDTRDYGSAIHKAIEDVVNYGTYDEAFSFHIDEFYKAMDEAGIEPITSEWVLYDEEIERATPIDLCGVRNGKLVPMDIKTFEKGMEYLPYGGKTFKHPLGDLYESKYSKVCLQVGIEKRWLLEKYGFKKNDVEDGYVVVLNDNGCELIALMDLNDLVEGMYEYS